jgi:epoxyqueuosine reductase
VCPWNKFASRATAGDFMPRAGLGAPRLAELAGLDDAAFRKIFSGSPVKRIGRDRFVRNVLIAIGNSGDADFLGIVRQRLDDASPLVRAMAVWALGRLASLDMLRDAAAHYRPGEPDPAVRSEWDALDRQGLALSAASPDQPSQLK